MNELSSTIALAQNRIAHLCARLEAEKGDSSPHLASEVLTEVETVLEELRVSDERSREQNRELLHAYDQLAAERERYARLFEEAPEGYFVTDTMGIIQQANAMTARLLGVRQRYLVGKPFINYVDFADRAALREQLLVFADLHRSKGGNASRSGDPPLPGTPLRYRATVRMVPPGTRSAFDALLQFAPLSSSNRNATEGVRWTLRDVSENTHSDMEYYQLLVDVIEDYAILVLDDDLRIMLWNRGAERFFGYTTDEAIGMNMKRLFPSDTRPQASLGAERARGTGRAGSDNQYLRKDGTHFFGSSVFIRLPGTNPARRFVTILRDITERRQSEQSEQTIRAGLEEHVRERTAELARANTSLQEEIMERQYAEEDRSDLLRRWVQSLEEERRRISRELHDEMGQHLTAFSLGLGALGEVIPPDPTFRSLLDNLLLMADNMGREIHRLAVELRPTSLDDLGLIAALTSYVEAWAGRTGIAAQFQVAGQERQRIPGEAETMLYRSTQEALNNILKYAEATEVSVLLQINTDQVTLIVEDNGRGFDPEEVATKKERTAPGGLGLIGMRERVSSLKGTLTVESTPGTGTTLFVRAPLP